MTEDILSGEFRDGDDLTGLTDEKRGVMRIKPLLDTRHQGRIVQECQVVDRQNLRDGSMERTDAVRRKENIRLLPAQEGGDAMVIPIFPQYRVTGRRSQRKSFQIGEHRLIPRKRPVMYEKVLVISVCGNQSATDLLDETTKTFHITIIGKPGIDNDAHIF